MWENLRTIVISSIMTIIILGGLIWAGVIPLQQQPNTYQLRQTIQETFTITGKNNQQTFTYPVKNITGEAAARTLNVYAEFNIIDNPNQGIVSLDLRLFDLLSQMDRDKVTSIQSKTFSSTSMTINISPLRSYVLFVTVIGSNITGNIKGTIVQEIIRT